MEFKSTTSHRMPGGAHTEKTISDYSAPNTIEWKRKTFMAETLYGGIDGESRIVTNQTFHNR